MTDNKMIFEITLGGTWFSDHEKFTGVIDVENWKILSVEEFMKLNTEKASVTINAEEGMKVYDFTKKEVRLASIIDGEGFGNAWAQQCEISGNIIVSVAEIFDTEGLEFDVELASGNENFDGNGSGYLPPGTDVDNLFGGMLIILRVKKLKKSKKSESTDFNTFITYDELTQE